MINGEVYPSLLLL